MMTKKNKILIGVAAIVLTIFWVNVGLFIYRYVEERRGEIRARAKEIHKKEARIQLMSVEREIDMFFTDCERYPTNEEGLDALVKAPDNCSNWGPDPYLKAIPVDPWGRPLVYEFKGGKEFLIRSLGEDGVPSEDDKDLASGTGVYF